MEREYFHDVVRSYGLDVSNIYNDISGSGIHLWNNSEETIGFALEINYPEWIPCFTFHTKIDGIDYHAIIPTAEIEEIKLKRVLEALVSGNYRIESKGKSKLKFISVFTIKSQILVSSIFRVQI